MNTTDSKKKSSEQPRQTQQQQQTRQPQAPPTQQQPPQPPQPPTLQQPPTPQQQVQEPVSRLPSETTLANATRLAISEDKPIMMDYWVDSINRSALIGVRESSNEKMLVKSPEEYTSPISKLYRSGTELIVVTENSIYLVSSDIPTKRIA
jgi:hypothetical protein